MRLFGFRIEIYREPRDPAARRRARLFRAVKELNTAWADTRDHKMWLSIWIEWAKHEVTVTKIDFKREQEVVND